MYAHQVIEDLTAACNPNNYSRVPGGEVFFLSLIKEIRNAQQFHLPDANGLADLFGSKGEKHFEGSLSDVVLPYDPSWIEISTPSFEHMKRIAALVYQPNNEDPDYIGIVPFSCQRHPNAGLRWQPGGIWNLVHTKGKLGEYEVNPEFVVSDRLAVLPTYSGGMYSDSTLDSDFRFNNTAVSLVNMALSLFATKNIVSSKVDPPIKLNKKRIKNGRQPLFSYYILKIKLPTTNKGRRASLEDLWHNRIHLQRSHFKTYTEDRPLFGKVTGRFLWRSHVRGQNKDGIVMKDYAVEPI